MLEGARFLRKKYCVGGGAQDPCDTDSPRTPHVFRHQRPLVPNRRVTSKGKDTPDEDEAIKGVMRYHAKFKMDQEQKR